MQLEPLAAFFVQYPDFNYNPAASATKEFDRLSKFEGWGKSSRRKKISKNAFKNGLVAQFNTSYGTDINDIANWHAIMTRLKITPLPDTVSACKKVVKGLFVNLVDLVDAREDPSRLVKQFNSEMELSKYTKNEGKFFPRETAKAGGVLKFLLRKIHYPTNRQRG
ncbi:hypothetical protein AGABI1DRAFT_45540 [Agaricus bisporus var. burnettii JB137-S8]|uniref:Uncharacterized protein n=1 Tax=Agaricus bisporus var. burnettii (strain JB137-S8 / ATCC MYA-4627 / FGSC 10392) TaxID=597362 RepID=K5WKX0_AGABU|nr:uncharacterized protein AGABI1DRAFT_45540 [Agaricus bisporus var. burnettii JB137-S8]EKM75956.1 hypothetical protein AGABI1DRAFT_45540 [Agaricus bisporus var. burnettii JB137-S8]